MLIHERSRGVSPSLFNKSKRTFLFRNRMLKIERTPTWTARCSAVSPCLSCSFKMDENSAPVDANLTISNLLSSTATWRKVLPLLSRKVAHSGNRPSKIWTALSLPLQAATCMGYDPSLSGWYTINSLASSNCVVGLVGFGQNCSDNLEKQLLQVSSDAAMWRGVLPFLSRWLVRWSRRDSVCVWPPSCISTFTSLHFCISVGSAAWGKGKSSV